MKRHDAIKTGFIILLMTFSMFGCEEENPVKLSYKDIYGNEDWPEKGGELVFYIDKSNNVDITENASTEKFPSYTITTTGAEPSVTTQRILSVYSNPQVITFDYKSTDTVELAISIDLYKSTGYSKLLGLQPQSEWTNYSFDIAKLIGENSWGGIGSYFRLFLGETEGVTIELKNLELRQRTKEEEEMASPLFPRWDLTFSTNGVEIEDLTEVFNYYTGYTYKYTVLNSFDPYVHTYPRERAIAEDENFLSFEYKCEASGEVQLFLKIDYVNSEFTWTDNLNFQASASMEDWTSITFDISRFKRLSLKQYPNSMDAGFRMRFDIGTPVGVPLYIRNIRIHK